MTTFRKVLGVIGICVGMGLLSAASGAFAETAGWGGEIVLGGAYISGRPSQLVVGDDNQKLSSLEARPDREVATEPYLSGALYYSLANLGTTLFLNAENGSADFSVGIQQSLGDIGQVSMAALYGQDEVWKDPYLTGVKRQKTDLERYGLTFGYAEIFGSGAFLTSTLRVIDVDQDEIGAREKQLQRDGEHYSFETGYRLALSESSELTPALRIEVQELQGEANTSDGAGASLTYGWGKDHWLLETTAAIGYAETRKAHPIFEKKRKSNTYELSTLIGYTMPVGGSAVTVYGMASYHRSDENISFFDGETGLVGLGLGVEF